MSYQSLIEENRIRQEKLFSSYDAVTGFRAPVGEQEHREELYIEDYSIATQFVPSEMLSHPLIIDILESGSIRNYIESHAEEYNEENITILERAIFKIRCKYDFAHWAFMLAKIKPKKGGGNNGEPVIAFLLNHPQQILLKKMETMRLAGVPIRIILLKARQWGGSTLVQVYMAWIQLCHKTGWNSTVIAHVKKTSLVIKGMYSILLKYYPAWMLDENSEDEEVHFTAYEGSNDIFAPTIGSNSSKQTPRMFNITVGTYNNPNAIRGENISMAHYSEVALWRETEGKSAEDILTDVDGGIDEEAYTLEVIESTAQGVGDYFYDEWQLSKDGDSAFKPLFIPWYEIERDTIKLSKSEEEFAAWLYTNKDNEDIVEGYRDSGRYYWYCWEQGATFEGINWYRKKRKAKHSHAAMASEAPTDDVEAFKSSGAPVFDLYDIDKLQKYIKEPRYVGTLLSSGKTFSKDSLSGLLFKARESGELSIWCHPETEVNAAYRYIVCVDIGGRNEKADYSVISVMDRFPLSFGGRPEIVAQWRGHAYHFEVGWIAMQIAAYYQNALLVVESNSLDKEKYTNPFAENEYFHNVIALLKDNYTNLYARNSNDPSNTKEGVQVKYGYQTNTLTKPLMIGNLQRAIHEQSYLERSQLCINEFKTYQQDGRKFFAPNGKHDDILMTRAIMLEVSDSMPMPYIIEEKPILYKTSSEISEAAF